MRHDYAARARALVGTRFRPQGRDPAIGLDCVGLVLEVFEIKADAVRRNYRMRGDHGAEIERELRRYFRRAPNDPRQPGDMLLLAVATDQFHFGICTNAGFVHADARLGRIVETPRSPPWTVLGTFRKQQPRG